jgi:hypothetical protein
MLSKTDDIFNATPIFSQPSSLPPSHFNITPLFNEYQANSQKVFTY